MVFNSYKLARNWIRKNAPNQGWRVMQIAYGNAVKWEVYKRG